MLRSVLFLIFWAYLALSPYTALAKDINWPPQIEKIDLNQKPQGWLKSHEKAGGHTIERHVNKSDFYLKKRVNSSDIFEASTFESLIAAEQIIALGLWENMEELSRWMKNKNTSDRLVIEVHDKTPIGRGIKRNEKKVSSRYGARIVLQKTKDKQSAFILTAYPKNRRP